MSKAGLFLCAAALGALAAAQEASAQQQPFPMEASISDLRQALDSGRLSSSGLVDFYLKRVEAYDRAGPDLNSLITVNPNAAAEAKRLDEESKDKQAKGPLYGVPVILKDNMNCSS